MVLHKKQPSIQATGLQCRPKTWSHKPELLCQIELVYVVSTSEDRRQKFVSDIRVATEPGPGKPVTSPVRRISGDSIEQLFDRINVDAVDLTHTIPGLTVWLNGKFSVYCTYRVDNSLF